MKPTLTELISKLEEQFGKLNSQAEHCAEDFHEIYQEFINSAQTNNIVIIASPNMLASKFQEPKYTRYRTFAGLSILLTIAGIISVFFN
jgi:CII-binding regulator of phage lambda lysogenization HflD